MSTTIKPIGWGRCTIGSHDDIVENSAQLTPEEGQEKTANIEGGSYEGRKKAPDRYTLTFKRRLGTASDVTPGYTENFGNIEVHPEDSDAVGVRLKGVSEHIAVGFDTTDGVVATYTYKTKGERDANGELTDIELI